MKQKITRPISIRIKYTRYVIPILLITFLYLNEKLNSGFGPNARVNSI